MRKSAFDLEGVRLSKARGLLKAFKRLETLGFKALEVDVLAPQPLSFPFAMKTDDLVKLGVGLGTALVVARLLWKRSRSEKRLTSVTAKKEEPLAKTGQGASEGGLCVFVCGATRSLDLLWLADGHGRGLLS